MEKTKFSITHKDEEMLVMRDENIEYAMRLLQAGVPTELHIYPGAFHGFEGLVPNAALSVRAVNEYTEALKRGLNRTPTQDVA